MSEKKQPVYPYQPPGSWFDDSRFFTEPFIKDIAANRRWTLTDHQEKKPLDINRILSGERVCGAFLSEGNWPYTDLKTIRENIPLATNATYCLDIGLDAHAVLDIEPSCPKEVLEELLCFPFDYAELSMSLKGLHLGLTLDPEDIRYLGERTVLKSGDGYYEILLRHHVAFSKRVLDLKPLQDPKPLSPFLRKLHDSMAKAVHVSPDITAERMTTQGTAKAAAVLAGYQYDKSLEDFGGDHSSYETAMAMSAWGRIKRSGKDGKPPATPEEAAWPIYDWLSSHLEPRRKHNETRQGSPWLLWIAAYAIGRCEASEKKEREETMDSIREDLEKIGNSAAAARKNAPGGQ